MEVQPPYPFNQSLPSSEGSDSEDQVDAGEDLPATPWHPRPMGVSATTHLVRKRLELPCLLLNWSQVCVFVSFVFADKMMFIT